MSEDPILLKPAEAARRLSVSPKTMYRLITEQQIRAVKVGSHWRVPTQAVIEFVKRLEKRVA